MKRNARIPIYDAEFIEPKSRPRFVDARPLAWLCIVAIVALFVAVLLVAGRMW